MAVRDKDLDILITGGTLLPLSDTHDIIENPWIGIRDGKIIFAEASPFPYHTVVRAQEMIDATGHLIMPGLVNAHAHLPMVLFRGLADDLPLMRWLNDFIFPAEARYIDRESVSVAARLAIAEMIRSGTTTFCDSYYFEDAVAEAAIECGMRGVVAQGFIDFPTPDQQDPSKKGDRARRFIGRWLNRSPLITPSLVCHSPYTCSPETLQIIKEVTRCTGTLFQIHLSETREEVLLLKQRYERSPVKHLEILDILDDRTVAAHCIWLENEEIEILARHRVKVVHDPESNMKLGAGIAPIGRMLQEGIDIGLGTDGSASNNDLDLFGEMAMCARLHKVFLSNPMALSAREVIRMATLGGAKVLGMASEIGSIVSGKCADLILLRLDQPHLTPLYNPFSQVVYAASGADVCTVIINGRVVMQNRQLQTLDVEKTMADVRRIASDIKADLHCHTL